MSLEKGYSIIEKDGYLRNSVISIAAFSVYQSFLQLLSEAFLFNRY